MPTALFSHHSPAQAEQERAAPPSGRDVDPDPGPVGTGAASQQLPDVPRQGDWHPVHLYRAGGARSLLDGVLVGGSVLVGTGRRWARRAAAGRPATGSRMLAPLALLAAAGVAAAVVVSALPGSGGLRADATRAGYAAAIGRGQVNAIRRAESALATEAARAVMPSTSAGSTSTASTATTSTTSPPTPSTPTTQARPAHASPSPASPASATDLEARGHELMAAGQYSRAVPVLQWALRAAGEQPGACSEPTTQACLTYAFALYDLGRSLRLAGKPSAAVRILKRRLQIDNQRAVVAAELAQARQQASRRAG